MADWLAAASAEEPLLLVLDDLQWAAKPTLLLLRHVVRAGGGRVLVLGTYRDTELAHDHPLVEVVADLRRQGGVERLSLSGLDDAGVAAFVEQAVGPGRSTKRASALARAVYEETEGNPFFVREVLRHLAETGAVERRRGRLDDPAPGRPAGHSGRGPGRRGPPTRPACPDDTNQALRIAAVVGPEFELGVVQAAGDLSEETLLAAVEEAAAARVVTEVSATRFRFAHALVRATLYESLTAARQVALHRKAAEAIETIHAGARSTTTSPPWPTTGRRPAPRSPTSPGLSTTPGRPVTGRSPNWPMTRRPTTTPRASTCSTPAAPTPPIPAAWSCSSAAARRNGGPAIPATARRCSTLPTWPQTLGDAAALARAALANTLGHMWTGVLQVDVDRVEMLEAAIAAVGEDDPPLRARLLATLGLELAWEPDPRRRLALSEEALRIARSLGDPETLAHVLLARDYTITAPENVDRTVRGHHRAAGDRRASSGDPVLASRALSLRFKAAMELADVAEAERCAGEEQGARRRAGPARADLGHAAPRRHPARASATTPDAEAADRRR